MLNARTLPRGLSGALLAGCWQERPANASTWLPERWEIRSALQATGSNFSRAISNFRFAPLRETPDNEA